MASRMYADRHTYTRVLQCSYTSVGLAQSRPNKSQYSTLEHDFTYSTVEHDFYKLTTTLKLLHNNHYLP